MGRRRWFGCDFIWHKYYATLQSTDSSPARDAAELSSAETLRIDGSMDFDLHVTRSASKGLPSLGARRPFDEIIPHFIIPFAPHPTNSKICKWHAERLVADRPVSPSLISRDVNFRSKLTNKDSSRIRKFRNYFVTVSTRVRRQDSCCRRWRFSGRHSCRSGFLKWFIN